MKKSLISLLKNIFAICMMYAIFVGAAVAVLFIVGFILGGNIGEQSAILGSKTMKSALTVSAIGSLAGMISFYLEGIHELTMDNEEEELVEG